MAEEIKLVKLESFTFDLNDPKIGEGVFVWSGNHVLKLRLDAQSEKIYAILYYNNIDRRIEKSKQKKARNNQTLKTNKDVQNILNKIKAQQLKEQELNVQQMINQNAQQR